MESDVDDEVARQSASDSSIRPTSEEPDSGALFNPRPKLTHLSVWGAEDYTHVNFPAKVEKPKSENAQSDLCIRHSCLCAASAAEC